MLNYMKRDIRIRFVETKTGLIRKELTHHYDTNFYFQKSRQVLHTFLDDFIEKSKSDDPDLDICLEFVCAPPEFVEGRLF